MSNRNKPVKLTPEQKQKQDDERFLQGRPNRAEVMNYVNALLEDKYMPEIMKHIQQTQQSMQLGFMAIQAILIQKGICTGEEIQEVTQEFIKKHQEELEKKIKKTTEEVKENI